MALRFRVGPPFPRGGAPEIHPKAMPCLGGIPLLVAARDFGPTELFIQAATLLAWWLQCILYIEIVVDCRDFIVIFLHETTENLVRSLHAEPKHTRLSYANLAAYAAETSNEHLVLLAEVPYRVALWG